MSRIHLRVLRNKREKNSLKPCRFRGGFIRYCRG